MDLKQRFDGLEGPLAIEVARLLFRYLTHRLDDRAFRRLFLAERPSGDSERAYEIALAAVRDIEMQENSTIRAFSNSTLHAYIGRLAELSNGLQPAPMDAHLREEAERELQLLRSL